VGGVPVIGRNYYLRVGKRAQRLIEVRAYFERSVYDSQLIMDLSKDITNQSEE
jgi:hypothetical protein